MNCMCVAHKSYHGNFSLLRCHGNDLEAADDKLSILSEKWKKQSCLRVCGFHTDTGPLIKLELPRLADSHTGYYPTIVAGRKTYKSSG